ncbi:Ig-like domain-containing protein [Opitutales bacterium]|nr:Ig-like domain-containing protein [Opitutales bacterium]
MIQPTALLNKILQATTFLVLLTVGLQAQTDPNFVDLGIRFITAPPAEVKINQVFSVQAEVYLDSNTTTVPAGETVTAEVTLVDPDGFIIQSVPQTWSGFNEDTAGTIANESGQLLLQVPWSQASKWSETALWKIVLRLTASSVESDLGDNLAEHSFSIQLPDLDVSISNVTSTDPLTGAETTNFVPNTNYTVSGTVTNTGEVMTQPSVRTAVVAQLRRLVPLTEGQYGLGTVMDEQSIVFPSADDPLLYLPPNASSEFTIGNLFLPADATGSFVVTLEVNPADTVGGRIMMEQSYTNNFRVFPSVPVDENSDGEIDFYQGNIIEVGSGGENATSFPQLEFVPNSYNGEKGTFRGLDPAFISFAIRNNGTRPVAAGDEISASVLLSKDLQVDDSDFILREFDLGGNGIGLGMLAGETINLTWFQQLPDNFEGDYYLIVEMNNRGTPRIANVDTTPIFSLSSQGKGTTGLVPTDTTTSTLASERPSSGKDGRYVVYEKSVPDANGENFQQIFLLDTQAPAAMPLLISKSFNDPSSQSSGNGSSLRPQISLDGTTVVFHSRASDLVPGDTNGKEDIFLYRVASNTLLRAVNDQDQQFNGRSLYPAVNGDGSIVVFESDATNAVTQNLNLQNQIFLWTLDPSGGGTITALTNGNGNSYNPSIDESGNRIVFDSFATNLLDGSLHTNGSSPFLPFGDVNSLRDIYFLDLTANTIYLASLNFDREQSQGGASMLPKISGDGQRIVYQSKAQNFVSGAGIATVVVTEGGAGYFGTPSIELVDEGFNSNGAPGSGAVLTLKPDGINALNELKDDAILVINTGTGYIKPNIQIIPDPAFPLPTYEAKVTAYLSNPEGDVYYVNVADLNGTTEGNSNIPTYSSRVSQSVENQTGGNFGSREPSINYDGSKIVYSTKSSNLLPESINRDDGKTFYNSTFELPTASAVLVGSIAEIEIENSGSGYSGGFLNIEDLSGTGFGAEASYEVDQRGRIVSIQIINSGENYRLESTQISVAEPLGGSGFLAGQARFFPTQGLGETRSGGGRIYKVEMNSYGLGYKIGEDENASFSDLVQFEGDGADLNGDGFPDGRLNPDRVHNFGGSLYLEQKFQVEILSGSSGLVGADILNTTLTISDKNNTLEPLIVEFEEGAGSSGRPTISITLGSTTKSDIRNGLIQLIDTHMDIATSGVVSRGPLIENNQSNGSTFTFSALSGRFTTNNPSAIKVIEESNMLIMGSGYTTVTPVINQVPSIYGFSEIRNDPSYSINQEAGRMTLLAQRDEESDDIYLFDLSSNTNTRVSRSSFGTPAGYLTNNLAPSPPSNRFPFISGNGRFVFFSSDSSGIEGLSFQHSNQLPTDNSPTRSLFIRDLKSSPITESSISLKMLYPSSDLNHSFAPQSSIPIIADLNYTGDFVQVRIYLNQSFAGIMEEFSGGRFNNFSSGRFTGSIQNLTGGEYSLQLVAFGAEGQILASSSIRRFNVSYYEGSLPPSAQLIYPSSLTAVTSTSVIPVQVSAIDSDGTVEKVNYYIDGIFERTIERFHGFSQSNQTYSHLIDIQSTLNSYEEQGVRSIFAVAEDNSGNYVATNMSNISFTKGSNQVPNVSIKSGVFGFELNSTDLNVSISDGAVSSIKLVNGVVGTELLSARLELSNDGNGTGALVEPILQTDPNLPNYGKIIDVNVTYGGSNYNLNEQFSLKIIPILRIVNEGVPASLFVNTSPPADQNATTFPASATLNENVDGSIKSGSGYAIAPLLRLYGYSFLGMSRVPLVQTTNPTSSLENFSVSVNVEIGSTGLTGLFGGFTQAPVIISVEANASDEVIVSVSLVINGQASDDYVLDHPTINNLYNFTWVPEDIGEYSIYALVKDNVGNVSSTPANVVSVENYNGSGISASFSGENDYEVESNGQLVIAGDATSAYGVSEMEFYIDNISVGKAFSNGGSGFQINVNFEDFNFRQGEHEVSLIARDSVGNTSGTFSRALTNLESRKNRTLTILPPITKNPPSVVLKSPETQQAITLGSSIRLHADANDTNGDLLGVQFYINEHIANAWSGSFDFNDSLPIDGETLIIDDGTSNSPIILEFDSNSLAFGGGAPAPIASAANDLDDLNIEGNYTHPQPIDFVIEIDSLGSSSSGTTDTFRWSKDGGISFVEERVAITAGINQALAYGLDANFTNSTGHKLGDRWGFTGRPKNNVVKIFSESSFKELNIFRTRNALHNALENACALGLLSIRSQTYSDPNLIHLNHVFDSLIQRPVSITGNVLNTNSGTLVLNNNDLNQDGLADNFILSQSKDSKFNEPFGFSWEANETGNFIVFAIAEDSNGTRVSSQPIVIEVVNAIGQIPVIELGRVEQSMIYSGSGLNVSLSAEASDPDGSIAEVSFYGNGVLIESDSTRPYSANFEINATGHYEVYAVARDNSGNLVTSNVRRIIVDEGGEEPEQPLVLTGSSAYLGGVGEIIATYKSENGSYDDNIRALVYIDGSYAGDADLLPRTPPGLGEEDSGQSFTYDLPARGAGVREVEIVILNDLETASASVELFFSESVLTDDLAFINMLYDGLFKRLPEGFENGQFYGRLEDGTLTREQAIEEISRRTEFIKARNMLLVHKTMFGEWRDLGTILSEIDPTFVLDSNDPTTIASYATRPDDAETADPSATLVGMNQVVRGIIETPSDIDTFRIASLGPNQNGLLTVTLEAGHPGANVNTKGGPADLIAENFLTAETIGINAISDFHPAGEGYGTSGIIQRTYDLRGFTGTTDWEFFVQVFGNPLDTGPYALIFENRPVLVAEEMENFFVNLGQVPSAIMDYNFESSVGYLTSKFEYYNQYGIIGTHDPEELFTRLYKNKYEQMPSPRQIVRATDLIADVNRTQFEFAHQFILENKVITQGAYNYTQTESNSSFASLAIPNVPHDIAAFADTALLYLALLDQAPSNSEVAKITLTPEYNLRPMIERARMIMEMPAFAARYGLAMPEVDLPNVRNGRTYSAGKNVLIDAASLGADNLAGTVDDGHIREIKVLFNGEDLDTAITADGFYYEFTIPSLPIGEYLMEVIAEDKNGLTSRAQRNIFLGTPSETVAFTRPAVDEILDIDEEVDFQFTLSDPTYSAYLEVNGRIPWIGNIQFSGEHLPDDESNLTIKDGVGGVVTFEFDTDFTTSSTQTDAVEKMYVEGTDSLSASTSNYLGTEYREYLIEIDGDGTGPNGNDTFRWSIDGGAHFNNSAIEIDEDTRHSLSAGIEVQFDDNTSYSLGDRWRLKAYPTHEIVEVGRYGSFADRLATTRQNLVDAINRAYNEGKLAIRAKRSEVESTSSGWFDSLDQNKYGIELRRVGDFPIREKLSVDTLVASDGNTTLSKADWLNSPWKDKAITNSPSTLFLDLSKMGFTQPMLEARVVAFDEQNNTIYSEPRSFTLRDPARLSIELGDPVGRKASVRIVGDLTTGLKANNFQVLDGGAGYTAYTAQLSIISEFGRGASLRPVINQLGELASVEVVNAGSGYTLSDLVLVSSPLQYKVGDSVSVSAKVRDPLSELDRVAFYVNGVELDVNSTSGSGNTYSASYEFTDESAQFVTARALYGDDRDRGPSTIAEDEWMSGQGISGDRLNYWGWKRHWAEQHFHGPGYVFPEWFIQDQEYWALPPPWLSLPYGPGALPVEVHTEPLVLTASSTYLGGVGEISGTYKSESGSYDSNIRALVYIDGSYAGDAGLLPRTPPGPGEEDPGQSFTYDIPARNLGGYEVEFIIIDGGSTSSTVLQLEVNASPLSDDYEFVKALWNGLFDRNPESAEINAYLAGLGNGSITRSQVFKHVRTREEFITARDILLGYKTLHGQWQELPVVLENTDQEGYGISGVGGVDSAAAQAAMGMPYTPADGNESDLGFYEGVADDHGNMVSNGTWIGMNESETLATLSYPRDIDVFKIRSSNLENEGRLGIILRRMLYNQLIDIEQWTANGTHWYELSVHFKDGSFTNIRTNQEHPDRANLPGSSAEIVYLYYDLSGFKNVDFYGFSIRDFYYDPPTLGAISITTENREYLNQANFLTEEEIAQLQIESRVNGFDLEQAVAYQASNFIYTDQYGAIGTHNPEEFFTRLFRNKYEQDPSPVQIARGVELLDGSIEQNLTATGISQQDFLSGFALDNAVMSVGAFNYTGNLAIPNVPLDAAAFGETALVYSALIGKAPSEAEVAKITLTPNYELRPMAERARMIMEMPAYAARYGLAMPEVSMLGVRNGREYDPGEVILIDATSLGADDLAGTADDGQVREIEVYLNGIQKASLSNGNLSTGTQYSFYQFTLPSDQPAGEYELEVVAEDIGGLRSRSSASITLRGTTDLNITAPALGEVLYWDQNINFTYSANATVTTYLEMDGLIPWMGRLAFDMTDLPEDNATLEITDGTGKDSVVFEFDNDNSPGVSPVLNLVEMVASQANNLSVSGTYLGTETRSYFIEIDGNGTSNGNDTFRWSLDGGATFNDSEIEISAGNLQALSSGVFIRFSNATANEVGDIWRVEAEPKRHIVKIGSYGNFEDRLGTTRNNLIHTINQVANANKLAIRAGVGSSDTSGGGGFFNQNTERYSIELRHDGSYPVVRPILVNPDAGAPSTTLIYKEDLPLISATGDGSSQTLSLDISKWLAPGTSLVKTRIVAISDDNSTSYSAPRHFEVRNNSRAYVDLIQPTGRKAVLRFKESFVGDELNASDIEIFDPGLGYDNDSVHFSFLTANGSGGELNATLDDNGSITALTVVSSGTGYAQGMQNL